MTDVCALVVTRNRRELLVQCLHAVLAQSHAVSEIVVYDNASRDGTRERLQSAGLMDSPRLRYVRGEVNLGGAGGYAKVLALGSQTRADWLWLMDDDAEPRPDALAALLASPAAHDPAVAGLCSTVVLPDGSVDPLHRCRLGRFVTPLPLSAYCAEVPAEVDCASFVGLLARTEAVRAAGLPRSEFFLGYDDAEYSLRLRREGSLRLIADSVVVHKGIIGGGVQTRRSAWCNRLLGLHYSSSPWESYWKDLYRIRNLVAMKVAHQGLSRVGLTVLIGGYVAKALLYEEHPIRRIPWLVRFARKGFRGDFSAPRPEEWMALARPGR